MTRGHEVVLYDLQGTPKVIARRAVRGPQVCAMDDEHLLVLGRQRVWDICAWADLEPVFQLSPPAALDPDTGVTSPDGCWLAHGNRREELVIVHLGTPLEYLERYSKLERTLAKVGSHIGWLNGRQFSPGLTPAWDLVKELRASGAREPAREEYMGNGEPNPVLYLQRVHLADGPATGLALDNERAFVLASDAYSASLRPYELHRLHQLPTRYALGVDVFNRDVAAIFGALAVDDPNGSLLGLVWTRISELEGGPPGPEDVVAVAWNLEDGTVRWRAPIDTDPNSLDANAVFASAAGIWLIDDGHTISVTPTGQVARRRLPPEVDGSATLTRSADGALWSLSADGVPIQLSSH